MSLLYFTGDQTRAADVAREIVKPLAVSDLESLISDKLGMGKEYVERTDELFTAVDPDYPAIDKGLQELCQRVKSLPDDIQALFDTFSDEHLKLEAIKEIAWFNLGFQAALRLLGNGRQS